MGEDVSCSALSKDHIRLMKVSSIVGEEVFCELSNFSIDALPEYYALSYTPDSAAVAASLVCDGTSVRATANLKEAICTLYNLPLILDLPIWIDAICINQQANAEKADQIRLMGDIYKKARKVVVWLGPARDDSDTAMDWIQPLTTVLPLIPQPLEVEKHAENGLPGGLHPLWAALGWLYRRKWSGRLWTFQEVVLAADVLMVCGEKTTGWEALATVAKHLKQIGLYPFCVGY